MISRCDKCGGLVSGRHLGFEAVCRCFRKTNKKIKTQREPSYRHPDAEDVAAIVKGVVGVESE